MVPSSTTAQRIRLCADGYPYEFIMYMCGGFNYVFAFIMQAGGVNANYQPRKRKKGKSSVHLLTHLQ